MRKIIATFFAGAAALLLSACSGGGGAVETTPSAAFISAADDLATSALLGLDDLPGGWSESPADEDDDPALGLSGNCAVLDADTLPGQIAGAESAEYKGPASQEIATETAVFPDEDAARTAFNSFTKTVGDCGGELVAAYEMLMRDSLAEQNIAEDAINDVSVTMENLGSPGVGEVSVGYRLKIDVAVQETELRYAFDLVYLLQGRTMGALTIWTSNGFPNPTERSQFATTLAIKLTEGDASHPA